MISLDKLTKSFGKLEVLNSISYTFEEGRIYGIVGHNGAGKTTLFRCMAGLEEYQGKVDCDRGKLKNQLGFLMTEPYFFARITGREYIRLLCDARGVEPGDIDKKNVFGLPLDQYASTYSTGMKKKLALTAILLQKNHYFIFDEPFNGVDIQSNMLISELLHSLRDKGCTVLLSSHIFQTLKESCDEIVLLNDGIFSQVAGRDQFSNLEERMKSGTPFMNLTELEL